MPPIAVIKGKALKFQVYKLLVDPAEGGFCQRDVAKHLDIAPSKIAYHVRKLEEEGAIRALNEHMNPKFYAKGPKSAILDKACEKLNIQINGGSVSPSTNSNFAGPDPDAPLEVEVEEARAHVNGSVTYPVLKLGELNRFTVRRDGKEVIVDLFPDKPYFKPAGKNVEAYKCTINYNGFETPLVYFHGVKKKTLQIWPPSRRLIPEQFDGAEHIMMLEAQDIANHLAKHAGWEFGLPSFKGDIEFAFDNLDWLKIIPESVRTARASTGDYWMDRSDGPLELETNDPKKGQKLAKLIVELPNTIPDLQEGQIVHSRRIYNMELTLDKMLELLDKILLIQEKDTEVSSKILEKDIMRTAERVASNKADEVEGAKASTDPYDGVMYQ